MAVMGVCDMKDNDSIFGAGNDKLDRLLRMGLHKPRQPQPPLQAVPAEMDPEMTVLQTVTTPEQPGSRIGRYQLVRVLGEGGMGVIYLAQQEHPVKRQVALKIIKPGMDSRRVLARFAAEQQALALMEHPHIAHVYDAGLAPSGRPYFVMEHVKGIPITEHCDKYKLTIEQRLGLFLHVCAAVQHAHQKGIIHRDLKPSNILVVIEDQEMIPKVIDFGVARAISQPLTEKTLYTEQGQLIGTPEYMSPEQADLSNQDIDTRTDIYSLGVVLYELLTGILPFDPDTFRTGGLEHIRKVICEEEPKTPSTRLSRTSAEESASSALRRQTDWRTLRRKLRGDLDWIVMRALEKDRNRRYETVNGLADDIRRHLACEPILACSPGMVYRLQKLLCKHRSGVLAALALVVITIGAAVVFSLWNRDRLRLAEAQGDSHRAILSQAREHYARGDRQMALETIKSILASKHVGPEAQLLYASILVDDRQSEEAMTLLGYLLKERPEIAGAAHSLLARILLESETLDAEKLKQFEEHSRQAKALLPKTAEAYFLGAMTAPTVKEQLAALDQVLQFDSQHYEARRLRAYTYYASRKYERMEHDAFAMTTLHQQDPLGYSLCAIAWRELGRYPEAIANYDRALALTLEESPQYAELSAQRCETFLRMGNYRQVLAEARKCVKSSADKSVFHYYEFFALVALGDYDGAADLFGQVMRSTPEARNQFEDRCAKYVFDTMDAGRAWHPPGKEPAGAAFLPMVEAEETYRALSTKAHRITMDAFNACLSPDGKKLAFSAGVHGYSGVAILDLATGETEMLIVPGKDPAWSPDGKYLAFVRDCQALRVEDFVAAERKDQHRSRAKEEVWLMNADGTQPRRLSRGGLPWWERASGNIIYQTRENGMLYSISPTGSEAERKRVTKYPVPRPSVSPDGQRVAYVQGGILQIMDLTTRTVVAEQRGPFSQWGVPLWSPTGREILVGSDNVKSGLWTYDVHSLRGFLGGPIKYPCPSVDGTRLIFILGLPLREIWTVDLDPDVSIVESLGPPQTMDEYFRKMVGFWTRRIDADPADANNYVHRAGYWEALRDEAKVQADRRRYWAALQRGLPPGSRLSGPWTLMRTLDGPAGFQLVMFWERQEDGMQVLRLTFGQRGGAKNSLEIPLLLASVAGLHFLPGVETPVTQAGFTFGEPVNVNSTFPFLDLAREGILCFSSDGREAYLDSPRPGGQGGYDLWVLGRATLADNWGLPKNLGPLVNSANDEGFVSISADGLTLCFNSDRPGGQGGEDLWITTRATKNDYWDPPVNLGPEINSSKLDVDPAFSPDGLELYFRRGPGSPFGLADIFVCRRVSPNDSWGPAVNLGPGINNIDGYSEEFISLSPDGLVLLFRCDYYGQLPSTATASEMWMSRRASPTNSWQAPLNLGPQLNRFGKDMIARILPDGATLFFTAQDDAGVRNCWMAPIRANIELDNMKDSGGNNN
jgi:Tol biopolymer transport system component/tetratricopeptide (TPR) repeat protein